MPGVYRHKRRAGRGWRFLKIDRIQETRGAPANLVRKATRSWEDPEEAQAAPRRRQAG